MASPSKRREMDMMKLMMSDYKVDTVNDDLQMFYVTFHGPTDSNSLFAFFFFFFLLAYKLLVEMP